MKTTIKIALTSATLAGMMFLSGCTGQSWFSYTGWVAKSDNRAALEEGGPHAAIWTTGDLALRYRYVLKDNQLDIEGRVVPQSRIKHFTNLTAWVSIHFLDADGRIVATHRLWSQRGSRTLGGLNWDFHHSWALPPGDRAVAFSFSGHAGDNDTRWDFWRTP